MNKTRLTLASLTAALAAAAAATAAPTDAAAQERAERPHIDIEVPALVLDTRGPEQPGEADEEIDLANIVQTAAKGVTTVQEAPAIVTVITAEEIRDRQYRNLEEVMDLVPGWLRHGAIYNQFPTALARGTFQAQLLMHDGLSLFDPMNNIASMGRVQPLETIKRIEVVTGPGGVLWGANSFLGIVNLITKDADDVDGVEAAVGFGSGNGDRSYFRGYVMAGVPELLSDKVRLFVHTSFETYIGPGYELPEHVFSSPLPQPNSQLLFGPLTRADPERSLLFQVDGKLGLGPVNVYFQLPWTQRRMPLGFPGDVIRKDLPEDDLPQCSEVPPFLEDGQPNPLVLDPTDPCIDRGHTSRDNQYNWFERYGMAEYRTRLAGGKAGLTLKGYLVQFYRNFTAIQILPAIPVLLEGGLGFTANMTVYRAGASLDGDVELPKNARLLYGGEAFREWLPDSTTRSRQGPGIQAIWRGPYDLSKLPLPCPREPDGAGGVRFVGRCPLTMAFQTDRVVLGAFVNPQWRPQKKLILDGGARVQVAPESLGDIGYSAQLLFSGALVYNFIPDWHIKLNYSEGFRPPVFNNLVSNGEMAQIDGSRDLTVETSQAGQAEVNARLFKGERRIRELNFRADYSYTRLENLIQIVGGRYENSADRGIHSAEFLGKLYLQGGHRVELGYTWLRIQMGDKGTFRAMPEHWFNLSGVFNLVPGKLEATTTLRVLGAFEDPNRMVEYRNRIYDPDTGQVVDLTGRPGFIDVQPSEMVVDRIPPAAELMAGVAYTGVDRLRLTASAYNALNARHFNPDAFHEYETRLEFLPSPYEDFRFVINAAYDY